MTQRHFFLVIISALMISATGIGLIVGGTGEPFDQIVGVKQWAIGVGMIVAGIGALALVNHVLSGVLNLVLGWALSETGVAALRMIGYAAIAWLGVMLLVAVTWAWLGNGSDWRSAPKRWVFGDCRQGALVMAALMRTGAPVKALS